MTVLRLALWQGAGVPGDLGATVAEAERRAAEAAAAGAGLLVLPEGFLTGYHLPGLAPGDLEGVERALGAVADAAARHGLAIVVGTHLEAGDGTLLNAAAAYDRAGRPLGRYAKRALFGPWERATFAPGTAPLRFDCGGFRVGVAICYDVEFPELVRGEARAGCDLVVVPTALMAPHEHVARLLVPARAAENQIFVAYANRAGSEPGYDYLGLSSIRGPRGEALAEAGAAPAMLVADLDKDLVARARAEASYLDDLARLGPTPV